MHTLTRALVAGVSALALAAPAYAQSLPQAEDSYFAAAKAQLAALMATQPNTGKAKNVILFVGDGLSVATITATRILEGQKKGVDGESNVLAFEKLLPWTALAKTYSHDGQTADSAPTATAMVAGVKTLNGVIGVNAQVTHSDCATQAGHEVTSLFGQAEDAGLATGVVSTARITHATPAAAYAHTVNRDWEADGNLPEGATACKDIATQLVTWPHGDGFEVILGGGRSNFLPNTVADAEYPEKKGARKDGKDLIADWQAAHNDGEFVWNLEQFNAVKPDTGRLFGLFEQSHMQYEADRAKDTGGEPSLAEMTAKAIDILSKNEKGFVLMVEGGRIDHAHHAGNAARALEDSIALSAAVQAAYEKSNPEETLIVLTADHAHVFTIAGYPKRNNPILGIGGIGDDGKAYTTLGYTNGPGAVTYSEVPTAPEGAKEGAPLTTRPDLKDVDTTDVDYLQQALVPLGSETHAGDDVAIFAQGPWAHLFHGVVEQNVIYHVMAKAIGLDGSAQ